MKKYYKHLIINLLGLVFITACLNNKDTDSDAFVSTFDLESDSLAKIAREGARLDSIAEHDLALKLQTFLVEDTLKLDSIEVCIANGANVNLPLPYSNNSRIYEGRGGSSLKEYIRANQTSYIEITALHALLYRQGLNYEVALLKLLNAGADPNFVTSDSMTALDWALWRKSENWVYDSLSTYGADPTRVNLHYALADYKLIDKFLALGADSATINPNNFLTREVAWESIKNGSYAPEKNVKKMLAYMVDPQKLNPGMLSRFLGFNETIMDLLVERGLDFNLPILKTKGIQVGDEYDYWLEYALSSRFHEKLLIYLLDHGATKCSETKHPLSYAEEANQPEKILILVREKCGSPEL